MSPTLVPTVAGRAGSSGCKGEALRMKTFSFVMSAAAISTAAILSACSSGTSPAVSGSQVSPSTARGVHHVTLRPNHGRSWMDPAAKAGSLLYITDSGSNTVLVYSYPALKLVGTLTGFTNPQGDCVDKARNVWIVNTEASQLLEYAHGGTTPIATLDDPNQYPVGCAFDSTTGELAVSNFYSTNGPPGSISIYKNASGSPTLYTPPNFAVVYYLGFDPKGTLYLDGIDSGSSFLFDSFNGTTFKSIVLGTRSAVRARFSPSAKTSWSAIRPTARMSPTRLGSAEQKEDW